METFLVTYRVVRTNGTVFYTTRNLGAPDFVEASRQAYGKVELIADCGWVVELLGIEKVR